MKRLVEVARGAISIQILEIGAGRVQVQAELSSKEGALLRFPAEWVDEGDDYTIAELDYTITAELGR